jgi:hypothetical protein
MIEPMLFLYDLPNWLLGVCIVGTILVLSYVGYFVFQRAWQPWLRDDNTEVAMGVLSAVATVSSLLLAFSAVSVWESFGSAEESVAQEANNVSALARQLAIYDSEQSRESRRLLRQYAELVVSVEWPQMRRAEESSDVWASFDRLFASIGALEPDTPRRVALLPEIWARTNDLLKHRRDRLFTSEAEISGTLWAVALMGTALTIVTSFVLPPTRFHLWMIGMLVVSMGLVVYLIIAMDRPFAGKESIGPEPFQVALENMRRWDARLLPAAR